MNASEKQTFLTREASMTGARSVNDRQRGDKANLCRRKAVRGPI
jgi:hypothetical protein